MGFEVKLPFGEFSFENDSLFSWADVEKCFWPGKGLSSMKINACLGKIAKKGGVYFLCWCDQVPKKMSLGEPTIKYIGETSVFKQRLYQFRQSAGIGRKPDDGHSAGWRWPKGMSEKLYVGFVVIDLKDKPALSKGVRCFIEGFSMEEYRKLHGNSPQVNTAQSKKKKGRVQFL